MRIRWTVLTAGILLLLTSACGSAAQPPVSVEQPTATPLSTLPPATVTIVAPVPETETPTALAAPSATATDSPTAPLTLAPLSVFGVTEDGLYFRGSPDPAALVVTDYSDFL